MPDQTGTSTNGGTPQGGTAAGTTPAATATQGAPSGGASFTERRDTIQGIADRLITRFGTAERALEALAGENFDYREQLRIRDNRVGELERNQVPQGAVILTGDDKAAWEKVKALNLSGDKVVERVKRADELETSYLADKRKSLVGELASASKYNADVLGPLLETNQLDGEIRSVTVRDTAGKETSEKVAYVRKRGDANATWEKLSEFATRDGSPLKPFIPALTANVQGTSGNTGGTTSGTTHTSQGVTHTFPAQSTGTSQGDGNTGSIVDQHLAARNKLAERTNPLKPAATTAK
jgi:hypothetical protein